MKYVVVDAEDGMEMIVGFSPVLSHRDIVDALRNAPKTMHLRPVSAGYAKVDGSAHCWGQSVSLGLASRPARDSLLLKDAVSAAEGTAG